MVRRMKMLNVFDPGVDYALPSVTAHGFRIKPRFCFRYSAGVGNVSPKTQWKLCEIDEIHRIVADGCDFVANSEWYGDRITEGAQSGFADGTADLQFWKARGLNKGAVIYVSYDAPQPIPSEYANIASYLRAYKDALGGYYRVGIYAGDTVIRYVLALKITTFAWRAMSDAWSDNGNYYMPGSAWRTTAEMVQKVSQACIWQTGNNWDGNSEIDQDVILRLPIGSHLEQETDMDIAENAALNNVAATMEAMRVGANTVWYYGPEGEPRVSMDFSGFWKRIGSEVASAIKSTIAEIEAEEPAGQHVAPTAATSDSSTNG